MSKARELGKMLRRVFGEGMVRIAAEHVEERGSVIETDAELGDFLEGLFGEEIMDVTVAAALCFASLSLPGLFLFRSLRYADSIRRRVVR